jgi:head-tail adaptor
VLASLGGTFFLCCGACGVFGLIAPKQQAKQSEPTKKTTETTEKPSETPKQETVEVKNPQDANSADEVIKKYTVANQLWASGKKKEAVEIYRAINEDSKALDRLSLADKSRVSSRIREYEQEQAAAKNDSAVQEEDRVAVQAIALTALSVAPKTGLTSPSQFTVAMRTAAKQLGAQKFLTIEPTRQWDSKTAVGDLRIFEYGPSGPKSSRIIFKKRRVDEYELSGANIDGTIYVVTPNGQVISEK